jgi:hypothetical protein
MRRVFLVESADDADEEKDETHAVIEVVAGPRLDDSALGSIWVHLRDLRIVRFNPCRFEA